MGAISDFMGRDHDRLDAIFADFCKEADGAKARELFARFDAGLRAHIAWEEEILFPAFEAKTGMRDAGPTAVMRTEHREIERVLAALAELAGRGDPADQARALFGVLGPHNQKEEHVLYPWLDRSLPGEETASMLERIERASEGGAG